MLGLGGVPLGGGAPRPQVVKGPTLPPPPPFYDDTPTMLPGQMNPLAASAARVATLPPATPQRSYDASAVGESTSIDLRLPLADGPEETTGEDPPPTSEEEPPFEDPSPTPPDGIPAVLSASQDSPGFRLGSRLSTSPQSAPPAEPPPEPAPRPAVNRLRARTIGHEEAAGLAHPLESSASEGTQMIPFNRSALSPLPRAAVPESGDPFANSTFEAPARPAPIVERTMAIDLSASGVSPEGAPPASTLKAPLQMAPAPPARPWGMAPESPPAAPPATTPSMAVWWAIGGVAFAVIVTVLAIALKSSGR